MKTIDDLQAEIDALVSKYDNMKVNLVHEGEGSEGIWAVPVDDVSHQRYEDESSHGEAIYVRLLNRPLGWCGLLWGSMVKARTQGEERPRAFEYDQEDNARLEAANKEVAEIFAHHP